MTLKRRRLLRALGAAALVAGALPLRPHDADAQSARIRVGILEDIANFDPHQFSFVNAPLIKNLYDSLIEYTPDGKAQPSLVTDWKVAPDSTSVTLTLRQGVKFHSGNAFNADAAQTIKMERPDAEALWHYRENIVNEFYGGLGMKMKMVAHVLRRSRSLHDVAAYMTLMGRKFDPASKTRPGTATPAAAFSPA